MKSCLEFWTFVVMHLHSYCLLSWQGNQENCDSNVIQIYIQVLFWYSLAFFFFKFLFLLRIEFIIRLFEININYGFWCEMTFPHALKWKVHYYLSQWHYYTEMKDLLLFVTTELLRCVLLFVTASLLRWNVSCVSFITTALLITIETRRQY